jgi:hypothetical protein
MSQSSSTPRTTPPLTDSPWFWLGLFAAMALVGLAVIGPKFARRSQRLETQQRVREQVWREKAEMPAAGSGIRRNFDSVDSPAERLDRNSGEFRYGSEPVRNSHEFRYGTGMSLAPIMVLLGVIVALAGGMLWRHQRRSRFNST